MDVLSTERLDLRLPVEADRQHFVGLFGDEAFMVYSGGVMSRADAHARFDGMLARAGEVPFAKQPIIERSTGSILGYTGVDRFEFEGEQRWEWGYRLATAARGKGYAAEASSALLEVAHATFEGEILGMVDPRNLPSQRVMEKLGFEFWKMATVNGYLDRLCRLRLPQPSSTYRA